MSKRIPSAFIEDMLARIDIVELIDARVSLRKKGNNYTALCPFHTEKTPSFTVSQPKQFYYCFGCGAHGNALGFLMQYERLDFKDALETLAHKVGVTLPTDFDVAENTAVNGYFSILNETAKIYRHFLKHSQNAIHYLKSRGLTGEIAKRFSLGYAPEAWENLTPILGQTETIKEQLVSAGLLIKKNDRYYDRFRARIMFPIRDMRGRVIAFGGRNLGNELPKYLNSPETIIFHKGSELYGLYEARQACGAQLEKLIIVEGYMDVIALAQLDIPYAVATLGTAITAKHIQKLRRYTSEIIFCFDGDVAGKKAAWRALENALPIMQDGLKIAFIFLPSGEDPDSFIRAQGTQAFLTLAAQAQPLSDFFFQHLLEQTDIKTADGKAKLAALAKTWLDKIPQGIFQQLMWQKLADMIQIDAKNLTVSSVSSVSTPPATSVRKKDRVLSPFKLAIILLLQNPTLVEQVAEFDFLKSLKTRDADNLHQLITLLKTNPTLTTGMILEHWRDQEDAALLASCAAYHHPISADGITAEFTGAFTRMHEAWRDELIQILLEKSKKQSLTSAEKQQLQALLKRCSNQE